MGWAANPTRKIESSFSLPIIQMGARVYLPSLGRFLQVDPIQGGTLNPYVYAHDPINMNDYSGQFAFAMPLVWAAPIAWGALLKGMAVVAAVAAGAYGAHKTGEAFRSKDQAKAKAKSVPIPYAPPSQRSCINCGIYKFVDSGATNSANKGKLYIGKTVNFDRRIAQHGARVTPGTVQKIDMSGQTLRAIRIREQIEINSGLIGLGGIPFDVKSGLLANRRNGVSQKNFNEIAQEELEFASSF
jgi:RHS repeat-associated protein